MSREAADVARRAAEIQQERGHCKGEYATADGRVCLWGSLIAASGIDSIWGSSGSLPAEIYLPIHAALSDMFPNDSDTAHPGASFNDKAETTERDVAKVLLQVADRLDIA